MIAKSLRDAATHTSSVQKLVLRKSQDLVCRNLMCERVGEACVCKLSLVLERLPQLEELDVSENKLQMLPPSIFQLSKLKQLNVSGNMLTSQSLEQLGQLKELQILHVENNPKIEQLPVKELPALKHIYARGTSLNLKLPEELKNVIVEN
ncbi:hypothetical protein THRCLA_21571 [Thraustotheca clavata]|uniref:Uncharacterized protein n=1 Tax=Thraustotheca clavata TaxID=74557 RepID=A0A1V9ZV51_9STRA|nr:hypothetical protein THRCLA_21571 [Thraustotheca clavata]